MQQGVFFVEKKRTIGFAAGLHHCCLFSNYPRFIPRIAQGHACWGHQKGVAESTQPQTTTLISKRRRMPYALLSLKFRDPKKCRPCRTWETQQSIYFLLLIGCFVKRVNAIYKDNSDNRTNEAFRNLTADDFGSKTLRAIFAQNV